MIMAIFAELERLVNLVQPQKLVFIAIDGVAPMAKMQQQRQRRFKSVRTQKVDSSSVSESSLVDRLKQALYSHKTSSQTFDPNCITPGTEFMALLDKYMHYYIQRKVDEDAAWRKLEVLYSGHQVPGEGEHKIMDFIRSQKSLPNFDPNTKHCLHGLDADLIMLALAMHEPHFCILREEVILRSKPKTLNSALTKTASFEQTQAMQFLHIGILREYLELELQLQSISHLQKAHEDELERLIDDFIFLTFFLGNDFLPHLPSADLDEYGFDAIFNAYRAIRSTRPDEFLVDSEKLHINPGFLSALFRHFGSREDGLLSTLNDQQQCRRNQIEKLHPGCFQVKPQPSLVLQNEPDVARSEPTVLAAPENRLEALLKRAVQQAGTETTRETDDDPKKKLGAFLHPAEMKAGKRAAPSQDPKSDASRLNHLFSNVSVTVTKHSSSYQQTQFTDESLSDKFVGIGDIPDKEAYYRELFLQNSASEIGVPQVCKEYLAGLVWVFHYYFQQGCASWRYGYPYHFTPLPTDLAEATDYISHVQFDRTQPLLPLQQLMAVLPLQSSTLLPAGLSNVMKTELKMFYPVNYPFIPDTRGREWRDIAVLPPVDIDLLRSAYEACVVQFPLSDDESDRNALKQPILFFFDAAHTCANASPLPNVLPSLPSRCKSKSFTIQEISSGFFRPRLLPGCLTGTVPPPASWPSLKFLSSTPHLKGGVVGVLGPRSKHTSLVLELKQSEPTLQPNEASALETEEHTLLDGVDPICLLPMIKKARLAQLVRILLGSTRMVDWPYPGEARIVAAEGPDGRFSLSKHRQVIQTAPQIPFDERCKQLCEDFLRNKGIDLPSIQLILEVSPVAGMCTSDSGAVVRQYSAQTRYIPATLIPAHPPREDARFVESSPQDMNQRVQKGDRVVLLDSEHFGMAATIVNKRKNNQQQLSSLQLKLIDCPTERSLRQLDQVAASHIQKPVKWMRSHEVARLLKCSPLVFSRLAGSITVKLDQELSFDLGLGLKFERRQLCIAGFSRVVLDKQRNSKIWEFSPLAVEAIQEFSEKFPDVIIKLSANPKSNQYNLEEIFDGNEKSTRLIEFISWLSQQHWNNLPLTPVGAKCLPNESITALETAALDHYQTSGKTELLDVKILEQIQLPVIRPPLAKLTQDHYNISPGHRVVNICPLGSVPFGLTGVVIATYDMYAEVMFDEPFLAGTNLNGKCRDFRALRVPLWALLNASTKERLAKVASSKSKSSTQKQSLRSAANPYALLQIH